MYATKSKTCLKIVETTSRRGRCHANTNTWIKWISSRITHNLILKLERICCWCFAADLSGQITPSCLDKKLSPYVLAQGRRWLANMLVLSTNRGTYARRCARFGLTRKRTVAYSSVIVMYLRMWKAIFSVSCYWVLHFAVYTVSTAVTCTCPLATFGGSICPWFCVVYSAMR